MKMRIQGNSLRLRLTQTEVSNFGKNGKCSGETAFPNGNSLACHLITSNDFGADFSDNTITISLPENEAKTWTETNQVELKKRLGDENGDGLNILIEKDFKCLTERQEDESDMFPNPNEVHP